MFNMRARYDWVMASDYRPCDLVGASHVGSMRNEPASFPDGNLPADNPPTTTLLKYTMPAYTTYDAAIGVAKDNWTLQLNGSNITNSDAEHVYLVRAVHQGGSAAASARDHGALSAISSDRTGLTQAVGSRVGCK